MSLLETMKRVAGQTQDASAPAAFVTGTVTAAEPLTIRVDNRFSISGDALVLLKGVTAGYYSTHRHGTAPGGEPPEYHYGLAAGDRVALLRNHGGQSFLVLGRLD